MTFMQCILMKMSQFLYVEVVKTHEPRVPHDTFIGRLNKVNF